MLRRAASPSPSGSCSATPALGIVNEGLTNSCASGEVRLHERPLVDIPVGLALVVIVRIILAKRREDFVDSQRGCTETVAEMTCEFQVVAVIFAK